MATQTPGTTDKIDLNSASKDELKRVPKVTDAVAQKIIDYRNQHGPFKSLEELKQHTGIGDTIVNELRKRVDLPTGSSERAAGGKKVNVEEY